MFTQFLDTSSYSTFASVVTIVFTAIFIIVVIRVIRLRASYISEVERLPMDSSDSPVNDTENEN